MEGWSFSIDADSLHVRVRRKRNRMGGKKNHEWFSLQQDWLWATLYILLVTLLWPMMVLVISIPFGQFRFFKSYISKLGSKMGFLR